jgi:hypothetical protein
MLLFKISVRLSRRFIQGNGTLILKRIIQNMLMILQLKSIWYVTNARRHSESRGDHANIISCKAENVGDLGFRLWWLFPLFLIVEFTKEEYVWPLLLMVHMKNGARIELLKVTSINMAKWGLLIGDTLNIPSWMCELLLCNSQWVESPYMC